MPGIYITAALLALFATLTIGGYLRARAPAWQRRALLAAFLCELPMCAVAFHGVRLPLDALVREVVDPKGALYPWITLLYAPLTEEPAKLLPLLLPLVRAGCGERPGGFDARARVRLAMALALGFGVGEAALIAAMIARNPAYRDLPFYAFGGYFNERFLVCLIHAGFTATALRCFGRGRPFASGVALAMLLHLGANAPILILGLLKKKLGEALVAQLLGLWVIGYAFVMVALLARYQNTPVRRFVLGRARCPLCGAEHDRPWIGVNRLGRRYERCPACQKWRWIVERRDTVTSDPDEPGHP